jgi:Ran GTPase-activating protein (RanGAP) involved in mRNA processing and transport
MDDFYTRYLRVCKECLVSPLECILSQLQRRTEDDTRILDLSSYNFTPDDCNALAKTLSYDTYFKEVRFNDCLLSEDASKIILYGMLRSRSLETIDLKGNNLRCSGADAVGIFLKKNTSVRCLRLDWNSLGLWGTGVGALAEGLAVNQTVVLLDLRNNQISHDGATELASSLTRNSTLKVLDLRWNNAGLLGGRAFLAALQYNKSLTSLELQGIIKRSDYTAGYLCTSHLKPRPPPDPQD